MKTKLIMDLDTGIDDALAIAYALGYANDTQAVDIIGVTTSFGNVTLENATKNSLNLLELLGRSDIPVFEGAANPWGSAIAYEPAPHLFRIHGDNGIGNVELGDPQQSPSSQTAVDFIIESAKQYGDHLILYTAGPMTNLAEAIKQDKAAIQNISKIVSMASALTVPGNVNEFAEANIHRDPQAAKYVFESDVEMTLVGLDVTLKTMLKGSDISSWHPIKTKASQALTELTTYYYTNEFEDETIGGAMHDPLAIEVALNPSIVKEAIKANLTVVTEGVATGRTTGNLALLDREFKNMTVCLDVDSDLFIQRFIDKVAKVLLQAN